MVAGRCSERGGVVDWGGFADWISHKHFLDALRLVSRIAGYVTSNSHRLHVDRNCLAVHSPLQGHAVVKDTKEVLGVVKVSDSLLNPKNAAKVGDKNVAPTTTEAQDKVTAGQRKINLLWEWTQAILAIIVTAVTLYVAAKMALSGEKNEAAFLLLSNAFFSVISVYLTRTNHTKTGGVKPGDEGR